MVTNERKRLTRRRALQALAASLATWSASAKLAARLPRDPENIQPEEIQLLRDCTFRDGVNMWTAKDSPKRQRAGILCPSGTNCQPLWDGAQWYSHFELGKAAAERLPSGSTRFFDGAKSFTFGAPGSVEADLIFALDARKEYNDIPPAAPGGWPHQLVEQKFLDNPMLSTLRSLSYTVSYRLLRAQAHKAEGWNEERHTAQFLAYLTVQNFNRASPGFGDYFWFGIPMYDARYKFPKRHTTADRGNDQKHGTGKFIYNPAGETFATRPAIDGEWISIGKDLLPLIHDGLEAAWAAGFLAGSKRKEDYHLGGFNMGWEVTGPWDVAMQVKGLSLTLTRASEPA